MKRQLLTSTATATAVGMLAFSGAVPAAAQNGDEEVRTNDTVEPIIGDVITSDGYHLQGETDEGPRTVEAKVIGLIPEGSDEDDALLTYCIDIHTALDEDSSYMEGTWEESEVPNLELVRWVLLNGFPNASDEELFDAAGVTEGDDWDEEEAGLVAYAGTQAAVWNLTDSFELDLDDPIQEDESDAAAAIVDIYEYLVDNATELPDPSEYFIELDGFDDARFEDGRFGPYWINSTAGDVALEAEGGSLELEDGSPATEVADGEDFYISLDEGVTDIVLGGSASFDLPVGRVFMAITEEAAISGDPQFDTHGAKDESQKLILAEPREGQIPAEWAFTLDLEEEKPAPRLPVTGSSLTWLFAGGLSLLLAGAIAMVAMRRRARNLEVH